MTTRSTVLQALLDGSFICPVAFSQGEYEHLLDAQAQQEVDAWLNEIGKRLARVGDAGAFFCAPLAVDASNMTAVRESLRSFRDVYGPYVQMINFIREAQDAFLCSAGEYIQLAAMETAVNDSSTLESQLRALLGVITGSNARNSNRDFLKRLLEHLKSAGYLVVANAQSETYQVTGKIDHLHAVLQYIIENEPAIAQKPTEDESQDDLLIADALEDENP